ncbi:MAG TPA: 50S ribosomal protein L10 [Candidatus Magasanikbacteria bacterium]|nr:50S ribosomal protein L10 [Candidatus Magasanikbacteria bacterium]
MPKTKQQKKVIVESLGDDVKKAKAVVFANFQGLTVKDSEDLRKKCRNVGVNVMVAKKTLLRKVCEELGFGDINPKTFEGSVATFTSEKDEIAPAKVVADFAKQNDKVLIYGGILENKFIASDYVKNLASLPSKQELLGKLVGSINAPVSGFVNVLAGNLRSLVNVLNNIKESKA